jgi:2-keto-4-pentenoate hydratase/2-oxohepta-3-ene-1,7-dioic acid hydratase in catechol pathway
MKLISYRVESLSTSDRPEGNLRSGPRSNSDSGVHTGVVLSAPNHEGQVLDLTEWIRSLPVSPEATRRNALAGIEAPKGGILRWLQSGPVALGSERSLIAEAGLGQASTFYELRKIKLYAPVPRPGKIIGVGRNYADHAKETGVDPFEKPRIIFKVPSSVAAPGAPIPLPPQVSKLDFEAELAVVIGAYAKNVRKEDALAYVAGYTILNDASAREFQFDISPPANHVREKYGLLCTDGALARHR